MTELTQRQKEAISFLIGAMSRCVQEGLSLHEIARVLMDWLRESVEKEKKQ